MQQNADRVESNAQQGRLSHVSAFVLVRGRGQHTCHAQVPGIRLEGLLMASGRRSDTSERERLPVCQGSVPLIQRHTQLLKLGSVYKQVLGPRGQEAENVVQE